MNSKWLTRNVIVLGLVSLLSDFGSEMATAILPAFLISLGGSAALLGLIEGIANASISVASIFSGWASDYTTARKPFAAAGYLMAALGIASLSLMHRAFYVLFGRILTRVGKGVRDPARDALLAGAGNTKVYGRIFGFARALDTVGAILGPLAAIVLLKFVTFGAIFMVGALITCLAFLLVVFAVHEVKAPSATRKSFTLHWHSVPRQFKSFCRAMGVFGLGNCAVTLLSLRVIELLEPSRGAFTAELFSIGLYALFNVFYAAFSFPVGYLADYVGKKKILFIGYLFTGLVLLGFACITANLGYLIVLFCAIGLAFAIVDGLQRAVAADLLHHEIRGTGYGMLAAITGVGNLFSSIVVGFLWTNINPFVGFAYAAIMCGIGALLLLLVKED